jgi:ABC-type uncharacterized transport system substrate-binding protein
MTARRFTLAVLAALALLAVPLAGRTQQDRVYRVGVIHQGGASYDQALKGLRDGLKELGLEEGKQFVLHVRDAKGDLKAVEEAARGLEAEKVDLIYTLATSVTRAAKRSTKSVSIVFYAGPIRLLSASSRRSRSPEGDSRASTAGPWTSPRSASSC